MPSKFQAHCQRLVDKLDPETRRNFAALSDDVARVQFLYPLAVDQKIELSTWAPKDLERADSLKASGNKLFQHRNFFHAINVYNEALLRCPQDFVEGQQLHDILIANRSAVFFELGQFEKVLKDVELLRSYNHHPTIHKLYLRAGKACEALKWYKTASEYYHLAAGLVTDAEQKAQLESKLKYLKGRNGEAKLKNKDVVLREHSITYPALNRKLSVRNSEGLGRYIVAEEDIKVGEIVGVESPYACVVTGDTYRTNCAVCMVSTNQPIACEYCSHACYCSLDCKNAATFHKFECKILLSLFDTGASVNCLMAFRMITQRNLQEILNDKDTIFRDRNIVIYKTNDHYNVYNLVSHSDTRSADEFVHYTFMSTYLLRLLKTTDFFGCATNDDFLTEDESYIASLILKHLQILQFNAHEISELENCDSKNNNKLEFKSATVGAGIYPTLALFNHSCDPSVIRYNMGNVMVLRAIKAIKRDEGVYENYGPLYTSDCKDDRLRKMKQLYWFDCMCKACSENWPLFNEIDNSILRVKCDCGSVIEADKDIENPTLSCSKCKRDKNILPILSAFIPLEKKISTAENLYAEGKFEEAVNRLIECIDVYSKHLAPPVCDIVLLQHRIKSCLVHLGNKHFNYKQ